MSYTCDDIIQWAKTYFPSFKFSKGPDGQNEPFYPVDVESWIVHCFCDTSAQPTPANCTNPKKRGTAMYKWRAASITEPADRWIIQPPVIPACQIRLDNGPNGIGNENFVTRPPRDPAHPNEAGESNGDWYLDFAGWSDPDVKLFGQLGYSWQTYKREVYDVLGLAPGTRPQEAGPDDPNPNAPMTFDPDNRALHAYAEFGSMQTILSELLDVQLDPELSAFKNAETKIQGKADDLSAFLGLTYYLFYPCYVPTDQKLMEGQWEAISIFLSDLGAGKLDPQFASYTQGYQGGIFPMPRASCKAFAEVEKDIANHPISYVAFGSHANYFTPRNSEQSTNSGVDWAKVGGYGTAGVLGAVALGLLVFSAWPAAIVVGVIALLVALFTWLSTKNYEDPAPPPYDKGSTNDAHGGEGAPAGGENAGTPDAPLSTPAPGTTGNAPFIVHTISADRDTEGEGCKQPSWWEFVGRWGVCVDDSIAMAIAGQGLSWSNGTPRRWPDGYTLTHTNVEALVDYITGEIDQKTRASHTFRPPVPRGPR